MDDQIAAARRTVCYYATDATEASTLMSMLGIHPSQEDPFGPEVPTPFNTSRFPYPD